jgi:hypothetical protein
MCGFLSGERMKRVVQKARTAVWVASVSMLFIGCAVGFFGCKRRQPPAGKASVPAAGAAPEVVVTNRMDDGAYLKALVENRREQGQKAAARQEVVSQMEKMVEEARAALPAGADNEAVKAELAKRPEWKALEGENARRLEEIRQTLVAARETVRLRMAAEGRDVNAVAEGRAVPAVGGRAPNP